MTNRLIKYIFVLIAALSATSCERDEFVDNKDNSGIYTGKLVEVPASISVVPFGGEEVKSEDYKVNECKIENFWLLQFGAKPSGKEDKDRPFLAAIYHPHVSGKNNLTQNYVKMAEEYLDKTDVVWIIANIGEKDINGKKFFSYSGKTIDTLYKDGMLLSEINQLKPLNGGKSYITDPSKGLAIPLSGYGEFNADDLEGIDSKKGLVVKIKSIVAKLTIDATNVANLTRMKLMRIPNKINFVPSKITLTQTKNLYYDYLIEDFEENTSASKTITLYIPQNLQQKSVFPEEQKTSGTAATKTKNAPAKATYVYLDVKSGSKRVSINVFPGGVDNTYTNDNDTDNSYNNYDIKANTHYTEVIKSNGTVYSNYLADKTDDSRMIEKIQHTVTSNCYILNPIIDPAEVKSGHEAYFNDFKYKEEYYSIPIIARVNEASAASGISIGPDDEWRVQVLWQDVQGRQVFFAESSGLKSWSYSTGKIPHKGTLADDNNNYATVYYGRGNSEKDGRVNIVVRHEKNDEKTAGNVLIALRKRKPGATGYGSDAWSSIIWSWHLWVTDYDPDAAGAWTSGTFQKSTPGDDGNPNGNGQRDGRVLHYGYWGDNYQWIMDRHLGALGWRPNGVASGKTYKSFGLYYQWGRKDPYPAQRLLTYGQKVGEIQLYNIRGVEIDTKIKSNDATSGTIWDATNNPTHIYKKAVITTYAGSTYYWNHPSACKRQGTKSIFDPCPPGWEVTPTGAYEGLVKKTDGDYNTQVDDKDGKYAVKFLYGTEPGSTLPPAGLWATQEQVNDGAWVISASGKLNDGEPANPTYYPNSGFINESGMKEMTGLGDLWCADQKNNNSGSFLYIGYSIHDISSDGKGLRSQFPVIVLKASNAPNYFSKDLAFSVRCVKR